MFPTIMFYNCYIIKTVALRCAFNLQLILIAQWLQKITFELTSLISLVFPESRISSSSGNCRLSFTLVVNSTSSTSTGTSLSRLSSKVTCDNSGAHSSTCTVDSRLKILIFCQNINLHKNEFYDSETLKLIIYKLFN